MCLFYRTERNATDFIRSASVTNYSLFCLKSKNPRRKNGKPIQTTGSLLSQWEPGSEKEVNYFIFGLSLFIRLFVFLFHRCVFLSINVFYYDRIKYINLLAMPYLSICIFRTIFWYLCIHLSAPTHQFIHEYICIQQSVHPWLSFL